LTLTSHGSGSLVSFQQRGPNELVRASVHYYNTEAEVDYLLQVLRDILAAEKSIND
jgi:selenocysteine lyase/cysteine desulfurase